MKEKDKWTWLVKTPLNIVKLIIKELWLNNDSDILSKTILEPAAWDGNFLLEIMKIYIEKWKTEHKNDKEIIDILEDKIYGWEINEKLLEKSIERINWLLDDYWISKKYKWNNLKIVNSIIEWNKSDNSNKFDYVIWNPPYIRIQNLSEEDRGIIRDNSTICKEWSLDMYIPFFEQWFQMLKKWGKLWFITPNTLLKTKSAKWLREFLVNNTNILKFIDFKENQVFDATTYSLISILEKSAISNDQVELYYSDENGNIEDKWNIDIKSQWIKNWNLLPVNENKEIEKYETKWTKLGKLTRISTWLWTLADNIFIHKIPDFNKSKKHQKINDINGNTFEIETELLKPIIKASRLKNKDHKQNLYIIFPYKIVFDEDKFVDKNKIISEDEMKNKFSWTWKYFNHYKKELLARDKWKKNNVAWYAFWRSQWIDTSFWKKILTSTMNKKPNFIYIDNPDITFISWYSISINTPELEKNVDKILEQLNSFEMEDYINKVSRDYRWWYKAYSKWFIENFWIEL